MAELFILIIYVHDLSPLALWYWCNMHIQVLSFKIRCLSQRFRTISVLEFKSTAPSWNVTLSCLYSSLPYHVVNCACILHHFKQESSLVEDLASLAYTTGTTSKHQRATWPELYRKLIVFLCIVVWELWECPLAY